jgi:CzcA family heavy metal efflux pump
MWIVKLALRRPYTFVVMALGILIIGVAAIRKTPTDIFPEIDIPVVSVIWTYNGLPADDMAKRITTYSEFTLSSVVSDVKDIQSHSLNGVTVIKVFFHPGVKIDAAIAQITAISQNIIRRMPPGILPPYIIRYNASSVPILQLSLSSDTLSESQLYDYGVYRLRQQIASVKGVRLPLPFGGAPRQVMVDLDPKSMAALGVTPMEVTEAVTAQNLILPSGTAKIGDRDYTVSLNSSPEALESFNDVPIKMVNGKTILLRDVAHVHDGFAIQKNVVRKDGRRSVLLTLLKGDGASTLDVVKRIKELLPSMQAAAPPGLTITPLFDQSIFVHAAVEGVIHEGMIAACLTALMILLFLGSWRSTLIVTISIPLSILCSIMVLSWLGYTLNVMTLGGLALAIGILVDDATVEIENIHRNLAMGKPLTRAILDGAQQIAVPAFVATLAICIAFVPVILLTGPARFLFVPMALAVTLAVMASYILSRTLVPVLVKYMLKHEVHSAHENKHPNLFGKIHARFNRGFERLQNRYLQALRWSLTNRGTVTLLFVLLIGSAAIAAPWVGRDFFPTVDAGQIRLHVRAQTGTRIEETERIFSQVEQFIRSIIPAKELSLMIDNIGVPDPINLSFSDSTSVGPADGEILIALGHERETKTQTYMKRLREELPRQFPELTFYFQPADIVSQILNFGLPAPINVEVAGFKPEVTYPLARQVEKRIAQIPGAVDVHLHQAMDSPDLRLNVDRTRAAQLGLSQKEIANNLLVSLSSSATIAPNYWADPKMGVPYPVAIQTPQHQVDGIEALMSTPISTGTNGTSQLLGNVATMERRQTPAVVSHSNVRTAFNIFAAADGADLGSVAAEVEKIVSEFKKKAPPGISIEVKGQVSSMTETFQRLALGMILAVTLVYLLMVVNFQSWIDPLIIILALPGAFTGIVWMLFLTHTTFSVPALMGAIMSVGVATANSILMITFAREQWMEGKSSLRAALAAGATRLRPVLMTALAMILGMLPMAVGLGEGGEQNAPLGRAVIGGLLIATLATLFIVPVAFSYFRQNSIRRDHEADFAAELQKTAIATANT